MGAGGKMWIFFSATAIAAESNGTAAKT